jgi:hypothetical protein
MDEQNFHDPECRTCMEIKKNKAHATIGLSFAMMICPQIFPSHQKLVGTGPMNGPLLLWN